MIMIRLGLLALAVGLFLAASVSDAADDADKKKGKRDPRPSSRGWIATRRRQARREEELASSARATIQPSDKIFGKLDANSDGSLSADELKKIGERKKKNKS